jgi:hypothetical protein
MSEKELIDDCFYVKKQRWGTWISEDTMGKQLITTLDRESCIHSTRFYLKGRQEGFSESKVIYDETVDGKL